MRNLGHWNRHVGSHLEAFPQVSELRLGGLIIRWSVVQVHPAPRLFWHVRGHVGSRWRSAQAVPGRSQAAERRVAMSINAHLGSSSVGGALARSFFPSTKSTGPVDNLILSEGRPRELVRPW